MIEGFEGLQALGLNKWEIAAYTAMLEIGSTTTGPLVKKSRVPHSKIYSVLDSLTEKGLASYVQKGGIKYFHAENPRKLTLMFREKEEALAAAIKKIRIKQETQQSVQMFEGFPAIRSLLTGLIRDAKKGEHFYGFSSGRTSASEEIEAFYEWWGERKKLSGLKDHLMISAGNKKSFESVIPASQLEGVRKKTRYPFLSFPGDVAVFRNHVIIFNYEYTPTAIMITSKSISGEYNEFFQQVWKNSR